MKKQLLTLAVASILLWSCHSESKRVAAADSSRKSIDTAKRDMHSAQISLDWDGTYKGTVPCADCPGIETIITLNKDQSYSMETKYLEKGKKVSVENGTFNWDKTGSKITLEGLKDAPNAYMVGEGQLIQLDMQGNKITGDLAAKYILTKK